MSQSINYAGMMAGVRIYSDWEKFVYYKHWMFLQEFLSIKMQLVETMCTRLKNAAQFLAFAVTLGLLRHNVCSGLDSSMGTLGFGRLSGKRHCD